MVLLWFSLVIAPESDLSALIEQLGSDSVRARDEASRELRRAGLSALSPLRGAWMHPDPEVAARAREAYYAIGSRLPPHHRCERRGNLHDLSVFVQRRTGSALLWTEEHSLERFKVLIVSDVCLREHPDVLFAAYRARLFASSKTIIPIGREGEKVFKLRPMPSSKNFPEVQALEAERLVTRVFLLRNAIPEERIAALAVRHLTDPRLVCFLGQMPAVLVTDTPPSLESWERALRDLDR